MLDAADFYPPPPPNVPADLTTPSRSYRLRVLVVLASLILFVALYLGLVVGSAYLCYASFSTLMRPDPAVGRFRLPRPPQRTDAMPTIVLVFAGVASAFLCLFLVKGFFKWKRTDPSLRLEVTERDQPVLFAFIRRLCQDTRAPLPHRVYLTPEVNAAVFYHESMLNLILPTPKNLVIGLGLVNQLNLSEFRAVLAHEFGHFSQNSMKLGSYVYRCNRIIADVVFGRDWLDDVVAALGRIDIRISIFVWAFAGVLWAVRKTLQGLFKAINFANASLSRQMEFNADLVAVSITGSDALIHGLARLDFANDALMHAWNDLTAAADHQIYSRNVFYHQTRAAEFLRSVRKDPHLGEPPPLPAPPDEVSQVFKPEDTSVPRMWATHPCNHDREANAKRTYIRSFIDERPPWVLFQDVPSVCENLSRQIYQVTRKLQDVPLEPPEVVQAFIDAEHAETTYDPRYHGLYDNRYIAPGDVEALGQAAAVEFADARRLDRFHAETYGDDLKARMEAHQARNKEYDLLSRIVHGAVALTGKDFQFRGARYPAVKAKPLFDQVQKEVDKDYEWMNALDRQVFMVHHEMARRGGVITVWELNERYAFHLALQDVHKLLAAHQQQVQITLGQIAGARELNQATFQGVLGVMRGACDALYQKLEEARNLRLPVLKNMTAGQPLSEFLMNRKLVARLSGHEKSLDGQWVGKFLEQLAEVLDKSKRIHFKSLGGLLAMQEKIAESWRSMRTAANTDDEAIRPSVNSGGSR